MIMPSRHPCCMWGTAAISERGVAKDSNDAIHRSKVTPWFVCRSTRLLEMAYEIHGVSSRQANGAHRHLSEVL